MHQEEFAEHGQHVCCVRFGSDVFLLKMLSLDTRTELAIYRRDRYPGGC